MLFRSGQGLTPRARELSQGRKERSEALMALREVNTQAALGIKNTPANEGDMGTWVSCITGGFITVCTTRED